MGNTWPFSEIRNKEPPNAARLAIKGINSKYKSYTMAYRIFLYNEITDLDVELVKRYISQKCSFAEVKIRDSFFIHFHSDELVKSIASVWETDIPGDGTINLPIGERLEYEENVYLNPESISLQVVYDGLQFMELMQAQIPQEEAMADTLHIFLTPRLMVTRGYMDKRHHARTILAGQPSIISSSGLVEAPARSVEYYIFQTGYKAMGKEIPDSVFKRKFQDQFLVHNDTRLIDVILGYVLQAVAYRFMGEGFCDDPCCRLFNAHRQEEMLRAQLESPDLCTRHQPLFDAVQ